MLCKHVGQGITIIYNDVIKIQYSLGIVLTVRFTENLDTVILIVYLALVLINQDIFFHSYHP